MRILEKIGVENTNLDGALFNYYISSGQDQVVQGVLEECQLTSLDAQTIQIRPGEFIIHGFRIHLDNPVELAVTATSTETVRRLVARLKLLADKQVEFDFYLTDGKYTAFQQNLFAANEGTYETIFGEITVTSTGVKSVVKVIPKGLLLQTKLDRIPSPGGDYAYVQGTSGTKLVKISSVEFADTIPIRDGNGQIQVPLTPTDANHAISLSYAQGAFLEGRTSYEPGGMRSIPCVKPYTTSQVEYIPLTPGKGGSTVPIRDPDGSLRAGYVKDGQYTTDDTLINQGALNYALALITSATIQGSDLAASGSLTNAIAQNDYGIFFVKGDSIKVEYTANDAAQSMSGDFHIIIKYSTGGDRILHMYPKSILGVPSITSFDGVLTSGISVSNGSSQYGCRVIKIKMKNI
jgi:hypothetical protein